MTELAERAGRHWNALAGLFVSEAVKEVWLALLALDDQGALDSAGAHAELWGLLERAAADRVEEIRR